VHQDRLYEARVQIWNAPPDHCPTCGWYADLGACGAGGGNQPPTVALTAPAPGTTVAAGGTVTLAADAHDNDGSIDRVEFFSGTVSLGVDAGAPYQLTWQNVPAGQHTLTAVATDDDGASA